MWLKTWWQYNFKYPAHLRRMSFIFHYQKIKEIWIWKYAAKNFLILQAFFINLWSRGKHSWLWIQRSRVRISVTPFLFHRKNCWCYWDSNTEHGIQSQLCLPLDHKFMKMLVKSKKNWPRTFKFKILQFFDNEIWNLFFSNVQDTWNYIVIKFSATQLHPNLKASDLNVQGDAMTPS